MKSRQPDSDGLDAPSWTRRTGLGSAAVTIALAVAVAFVDVPIGVAGPGVVRATGRAPVRSEKSGTVSWVAPLGTEVEAGSEIARVRGEADDVELARARGDWRAAVALALASPGDSAGRVAATEMKRRLASILTAGAEWVVRSPRAGVFGDVRVQVAQRIETAQVVGWVTPSDTSYELWAYLPGQQLPLLRPGQHVTFQLTGYANAELSLILHSVDASVVGPQEVSRQLGVELASTVASAGPIAIARATLSGQTFRDGEVAHPFADGLSGRVSLEIQTLSVWNWLAAWAAERPPREP